MGPYVRGTLSWAKRLWIGFASAWVFSGSSLDADPSMQRSPMRFTLTSSCKQIQLKAWRVDWDGLPPDRSLCTGAPWETEIVLPRCDSSVWLNVCCHIRYLSSFRKRSWPIGVEHSTGFELQFVWKNFDKWGKTAPSPHDGRKLDERPLEESWSSKGSVKDADETCSITSSDWSLAAIFFMRPQSPEWPDSNAWILFGDRAACF